MELKRLQNDYRKITSTMGCFSILESARDLSVSPANAKTDGRKTSPNISNATRR